MKLAFGIRMKVVVNLLLGWALLFSQTSAQIANIKEQLLTYQWITHKNFHRGEEFDQLSTTSSCSVTLCTHLSADRIDRLALLAERWRGPLSAAIYFNTTDLIAASELIFKWLKVSDALNFYSVLHIVQVSVRFWPL